jgi:transcription initiation factor TFIID subunit 2
MDGSTEQKKSEDEAVKAREESKFTLFHQKVDLDLNFSQQVAGRTEIEIHPESKNFKYVFLHAQQCRIIKVTVNDIPTPFYHQDPCDQTQLHFDATAHQHHVLAEKIDGLRGKPNANLAFTVPQSIGIREVDETDIHTQNGGTVRIPNTGGSDAIEATRGLTDTSVAKYTPLTVVIEFNSIHIRDAVQFVTGPRGSGRWPHAFTRGRPGGASAATLFPCIDELYARGTWEISITTPQTVGDALRQTVAYDLAGLSLNDKGNNTSRPAHENKEMTVVCTGELVSERVSKIDPAKKIVSFVCMERISAQQIGFAVGPFERVDLSVFRDVEDREKLGDSAVQMYAYCLPRRSEDVRNTCLPCTKAMDTFVQRYSASPFQPYSMCFIEDMPHDLSVFAGISVCSTRLLYPDTIQDPAQDVTRKLVHGIASQWVGINIIPETSFDTWVVVGIAHFMTDLFMKDLCGLNEYRARMADTAHEIVEQDRERPSIYDMGDVMHVDPSAYEFIALKAPVVLFILDRRMTKTAGATKMPGIISKILTRARTGDLENNTLSTEFFQKTTERANHGPIGDFMQQWVKGAGCPHFKITHRFNKKKLTIEMMFDQVAPNTDRELEPSTFMRDVREDWHVVYAGERQQFFTGPMTIRIHEADGTPYEHIVYIKEGRAQIDVPYNTKYKRLKRTRKLRNKAAGKAAGDEDDEEKDTLVYYLGDILQSEEELEEWDLLDWNQEMENAASQESFEWIRADADFEWIARMDLSLQGYMYASQLQQDRDIVSQLMAIRSIMRYGGDKTVSSILLRTLMDRRYFHRIRYLAAHGLVRHAGVRNSTTNELVHVGSFHLKKAFDTLFCTHEQGSSIIRPNDFSDHQQYLAQLAIVEAVSKIRDENGHAPLDVKEWMLDKLKFNDNSNNDFSDAYYVATLMRGLANALAAKPSSFDTSTMDLEETRRYVKMQQVEQSCIEEIDRYRRMDEWTSSYQNLYSRTALECQAVLAEAGIYRYSPLHFLQYTRPGNYDLLRLTAYQILVSPHLLAQHSILKYIIHCMVADSSPLIRHQLQKVVGEVLGRRAIGEKKEDIIIDKNDLMIEDVEQAGPEGAAQALKRAEELARRHNIEAALAALKKELGGDEVLKKALWDAANYADITIEDLGTTLDFCRMLFASKDEIRVKLEYPRYWSVKHLGKVCLLFPQLHCGLSTPWLRPIH